MLLNEIRLDIKADITWSKPSPSKHLGEFVLGLDTYQIDLNELEIELSSGSKKILDIAFRKNGESSLTGDNKPFRILGPILHALREILPKINPDILTFGVLNEHGNTEKRKSVYSNLNFLMSKFTGFSQYNKWIDIGIGEYTFAVKSSEGISRQDSEAMEKWLASIKDKSQ